MGLEARQTDFILASPQILVDFPSIPLEALLFLVATERWNVVAAANSPLTVKTNSIISWDFLLLLMVPGRIDKATRIHKNALSNPVSLNGRLHTPSPLFAQEYLAMPGDNFSCHNKGWD